MSLYDVNNEPTIEKIEYYDSDSNIFYRFQMKDWEMGNKSWGMIYSSEEEAIEFCQEYGLTPEQAILKGKSACSTATELMNFACSFDKDFRVLILNGVSVGFGHDGEDVVDVKEILEIWDYDKFTDLMIALEAQE